MRHAILVAIIFPHLFTAGDAAAPPLAAPIEDAVDVLEVNHLYDGDGRHIFDQLIGWNWHGNELHVVFWRLLKGREAFPQRRFASGVYEALWIDDGQARRVRGRSFRQTWTQHDPELANRQRWPQSQRRGLTRSLEP